MPKFVKAVRKDEILERCGTKIELEGKDIAIFKCGSDYFAISNVCSHQHFSLLHHGRLNLSTVECPMHGWTYDVKTGYAVIGNGKVVTYNVRIDGDHVWIELPDE